MGKLVLLDARLFVGAADLSGHGSKIEIESEIEAKEITNWRSGGAKEVLGGLETVSIDAEGQWEAGDPGKIDDQAWADRRVLEAWTAGAESASDTGVGSVAYLTKALRSSIKLFAAVGDVAPWSAKATGTWPLVRGEFAHPSGVARTTDGNGTAVELGAVAAGQRLYGSLHVLSVAGTLIPEIDVIVQSDSAEAFNVTPETRLSFATATAPGGQVLRTDGTAHADTWYRVVWDITDNGGTGESFLFVAAIGIE
jgi:hypothetical protein